MRHLLFWSGLAMIPGKWSKRPLPILDIKVPRYRKTMQKTRKNIHCFPFSDKHVKIAFFREVRSCPVFSGIWKEEEGYNIWLFSDNYAVKPPYFYFKSKFLSYYIINSDFWRLLIGILENICFRYCWGRGGRPENKQPVPVIAGWDFKFAGCHRKKIAGKYSTSVADFDDAKLDLAMRNRLWWPISTM